MKALSLSQPHAIILVGIPGSGKTYFAKKFSKTFNAPFVELDAIVPYANSPENAALLAQSQLEQLLKTNLSIILELNTASRQNRTEISRFLREAGYGTLLLWIQTDNATAKKRIQKKNINFEDAIHTFSPPHSKENPIVISGKHTYATQAKTVLQKLSAPRTETPLDTKRTRRGNIIIQ